MVRAIVLAAILLPAGCGRDAIVGRITLADPYDDEDSADSETRVINFGETVAGTVDATVAVTNPRPSALTIERIEYTNPDSFSVYADEIPGVLASGETAYIEVTFHPAHPGIFESRVRLYLEGRVEPVEVLLSGARVAER